MTDTHVSGNQALAIPSTLTSRSHQHSVSHQMADMCPCTLWQITREFDATEMINSPIKTDVIPMRCKSGISKYFAMLGGGARVVVITADFHAGGRGSFPGLGGLKKQNYFFPIHS